MTTFLRQLRCMRRLLHSSMNNKGVNEMRGTFLEREKRQPKQRAVCIGSCLGRRLSGINAGVTQLDRVRGYYPLSRRFEADPRHQFNLHGCPTLERRAAATRQVPRRKSRITPARVILF